MEDYYSITFQSTHSAIASEKYLSQAIKVRIMPTLREISNSCGISIRIDPKDYEEAKEKMENFTVEDYHIYFVQGKEVTKIQ